MRRQALVPLPCTLIAAGIVAIAITNPANAFSLRKVYADDARAGIQLKVWPGYGLSINLLPLHATIKGAWLGDQSHFTLSSNGRLCPQGAGAELSQTCAGPDATVVFLREVLINFPGLMSSANGSTVLRLSVDEPDGEREYLFRLIPAKGEPEYTDIAILPESEKPAPLLLAPARQQLPGSSLPTAPSVVSLHPVPAHNHVRQPSEKSIAPVLTRPPKQSVVQPKTAQSSLPAQTYQQKAVVSPSLVSINQRQVEPIATKQSQANSSIEDANTMAFGLRVANEKGQIRVGTTVWQQVQDVIIWLRRGYSRGDAANKASLKPSVLQQLLQWGQNRP